jgi:hypothetical protein
MKGSFFTKSFLRNSKYFDLCIVFVCTSGGPSINILTHFPDLSTCFNVFFSESMLL